MNTIFKMHHLPQNFSKLSIFFTVALIVCASALKDSSFSPVYRPSKQPKLPHQNRQPLPEGNAGERGKKHLPFPTPTIMKIFENPNPNDGYESLRAFSRDLKDGMFGLGSKTILYNTSVAFTSPLFAFQLPTNKNSETATINMANQTIFGMFAMFASVLIFALPVLLTGQKFNPSAFSRSNKEDESLISKILKMEPLATLIQNGVHKKIGLEPEKCLQKTICEANRFPDSKRYGMLAVPFQIFYPPPSQGKDQSRATSVQEAAYTGKYLKSRCGKKYNCFFDVLDLGRYLLDWYQYHNGGLDTNE